MGDRWNPTIRTVTTVKPFKFFVPGDSEAAGEPQRPAGRSWTTRRRGDTTGTVKHSYRCSVHGAFDAMVLRAEVPDAVACTSRLSSSEAVTLFEGTDQTGSLCGRLSLWAGSTCGIGHASGEVES